MESVLLAAVKAADERKRAVMGDGPPRFGYSGGELQDRAMFSGFDLDHAEVIEVARAAGQMFWLSSQGFPLLPLFTAAWCDGLLVGLLYAKLLALPSDEVRPDGG